MEFITKYAKELEVGDIVDHVDVYGKEPELDKVIQVDSGYRGEVNVMFEEVGDVLVASEHMFSVLVKEEE